MVGCPLDSDGDGVPDYLDECEATPAAAYGMVDSVGCPVDTDLDGVPDYLDLCPDTPEEERPYVNMHGCPFDSDGDGVTDNIDQCPDTPEEAWGQVDSVGCPLDRDGDFVPDYLDECPDTPGSWKYMGCPEIKQEVKQAVQQAMEGIHFETGKATIKPNSYEALDHLADLLKENPHYHLTVHGHTDNVGSYKINKALSLRRANAVRNYLLSKGVADSAMTVDGFAYNNPIASNDTAKGRAKNRRVDLTITYEE
jgi:outer membrane protein OmpA-like peptidoglycan-associated protein